MAYATIDDLTSRYRPITTMIGSGDYDVTSDDVSSIFIQDAESYIDARLAVRYVTPLKNINPLITRIACDLATHEMLAEKMPTVPEFMEKRYERANEMLDMLVVGKLLLNSETLVGSSGDSYAWSSTIGTHPIFSPVVNELVQAPDAVRVKAETNERLADDPVP
jgi:phage gp36-like protein